MTFKDNEKIGCQALFLQKSRYFNISKSDRHKGTTIDPLKDMRQSV